MPLYGGYGLSSQTQNAYEQSLKNIINQANTQLQQLQNQPAPVMPQQPQINQSFQLAPTPSNSELESKYANNIDEVRNTFVSRTGVFLTKDFSTIWIKTVDGNIKTFRTEEIIEMDEKEKENYHHLKQLADKQM